MKWWKKCQEPGEHVVSKRVSCFPLLPSTLRGCSPPRSEFSGQSALMSNTLDNRKARLSPTHHPRRTHRLAQVSRCVSSLFSGPYLYFTWCQRHRFPLEQNPMTGIINDSANLTRFSGSVQFSSVAQSCPALCNPMNRCTPGLPVHHQLPEFTQTHVHQVEHVKLIESILLTVHPLLHGPFSLQLQKPVIPSWALSDLLKAVAKVHWHVDREKHWKILFWVWFLQMSPGAAMEARPTLSAA